MKSGLNFFVKNALITCDLNTPTAVSLAKIHAAAVTPKSSKMVKDFAPKDPNRATVSYVGIEFFISDEDLSSDEFSAVIENEVIEAVIGIIDSEPIIDRESYFDNEEEAATGLTKLFGQALPPIRVHWHYWDNMNTLSNFAFAGFGQYYLSSCPKDSKAHCPGACYHIDLSSWSQYTVRKGFEPYGVIAYFDENRVPCGYYWCSQERLVLVGDELFFRVGVLLRTTTHAVLTLRDHLLGIHWVVSNSTVLSCERWLDAQHPVRRLLKPHTYGSSHINLAGAITLSPYGGIASRLFGLDEAGWARACSEELKEFKYETVSERFDRMKLPASVQSHMPYYVDGMDLWNIHKAYVAAYIDIFYPFDDDLAKDEELQAYWKGLLEASPGKMYKVGTFSRAGLVMQLTHFIFWTTGGHSFVGSTAEYLLSPFAFPGKLRLQQDQADKQTLVLQNALISLTTGPQPMLLSDWSHLHSYDLLDQPSQKGRKQLVLDNLANWQSGLKALVKTINERNSLRAQPFVAMRPDLIESSVSV